MLPRHVAWPGLLPDKCLAAAWGGRASLRLNLLLTISRSASWGTDHSLGIFCLESRGKATASFLGGPFTHYPQLSLHFPWISTPVDLTNPSISTILGLLKQHPKFESLGSSLLSPYCSVLPLLNFLPVALHSSPLKPFPSVCIIFI